MKPIVPFLASAIALLSLSSCSLTEQLWDKSLAGGNPWHYEKIHSFGVTKPDSQYLTPNRLILLGENAVYVTELTPDHKLVQALRTTNLAKPFGYKLRVTLDKRTGNFTAVSQSKTELCLSYVLFNDSPEEWKKNDIPKLQALGFKKQPYPDNPNVTDYYVQCYGAVNGVRHAMKGTLPAEYHFKIPVQIYVETPSINPKTDKVGSVTRAVFLTPFTIIGDLILLPLSPYRGAKP